METPRSQNSMRTPSIGSDSEDWNEIISKNSGQDDPIVIIGLGFRLPGDNSSPAKLWEFLRENRSAQGPWPPSRLNVEGFYHQDRERPGSIHATGGYFIQSDLNEFDNDFFGINNIEASRMDPQQKKLLEVVYECFENSGTPLEKVSGTPVGCFVGNFLSDHLSNQFMDPDYSNSYTSTGITPTILSNRISHAFNLQGPSLTVDTACSSSIYALHLACQAIRGRECESAIVAAANLLQSIPFHIATVKSGVLSTTSTCHTFDSSADGYGRGDAVSAIQVKRLSAALRDGDQIRAVIRGSAVNANGRTPGISQPKAETQATVIKSAYANAGLSMDETAYVECHGTGTAVGDPIELNGLAQAFGRSERHNLRLRVGSVKTNLGHSEAASGLTSIAKVILSFEHNLIPATIGVTSINRKIRSDEWNMEIVTKNCPWPTEYKFQRASINSFGFGGANAHVILESPASYFAHISKSGLEQDLPLSQQQKTFLIPMSANDPESLKKMVASYSQAAESIDTRPFLFELSARRTLSHTHRGFIVANEEQLHSSLSTLPLHTATKPLQSPPDVAFVFTGQGAQWPGMGKELLGQFSRFREMIDKMDAALQALPDGPTWHIEEAILEPAETSKIQTAALSQPICTAVQVGLVAVLKDFGILPKGIIGHSSGEIAAAYAAGILSAEQAIICAFYRGKSVSEIQTDGAMLAVQLTLEQATAIIEEIGMVNKVVAACLNSPTSITLSGDRIGIEAIQAKLKSENKFARILITGGKAYHSHHMKAIGPKYVERMEKTLGPVQGPHEDIRFISTRTNDRVSEGLGADYWRDNAESSVLFSPGLKTLFDGHNYHLVELGPHSALAMPIKQIIKDLPTEPTNFAYFSALTRGLDGAECLLKLLGNLFLAGHKVNMSAVNGFTSNQPRFQNSQSLPSYPWNYQNVLSNESRWLREYRSRKHVRHDLLGSEQVGDSKREKTWRNVMGVNDLPWLKDHRLGQTVIFPAAGYCAIAIEAALQFGKDSSQEASFVILRDVVISSPLILPTKKSEKGVEVFTHLLPAGFNVWKFEIRSIKDDEAKQHVEGTIEIRSKDQTIPRLHPVVSAWVNTDGKPIDKTEFYSSVEKQGLVFGEQFKSVSNLISHTTVDRLPSAEATTSAHREKKGTFKGESRYPLHPITLDALLQASIAATSQGKMQDLKAAVPTHLGSIAIKIDELASCQLEEYDIKANAFVHEFSQTSIEADLLGADGTVLVQLSDVRLSAFNGGQFEEKTVKRSPIAKIEWRPDILLNKRVELTDGILSQFESKQDIHAMLDLMCHKSPNLHILQIHASNPDVVPVDFSTALTRGFSLSRFASYTHANLTDGQLLKLDTAEDLSSEAYDLVVADIDVLTQLSAVHSSSKIQAVENAILLTSTTNSYSASVLESLDLLTHVIMPHSGPEQPVLGRFKSQQKETTSSDTIFIVGRDDGSTARIVDSLVENFSYAGSDIRQVKFEPADLELLPEKSTVICLMEAFAPLLISMDQKHISALQTLLSRVSRLLWVSGGDIINGGNPDFALIQGIARTVRLEQPEVEFLTLNINAQEVNTRLLSSHLASILGQKSDGLVKDYEFILRNQTLEVSRLVPREALNSTYRQKEGLEVSYKSLEDCNNERLCMKIPGWSSSLRFAEDGEAGNGPSPDQLEIQVKTVGLTAWNVSVLQGRAAQPCDTPMTQFAGFVSRVGSDVAGFEVGDRVLALAPTNLQKFVTVSSNACQKLLSAEDMKMMSMVPIPFGTALHALRDRVQIQPNEAVLIHWSGDDAELAAIKLAQSLGARPFVIVNEENEQATVIKATGIAPSKVSAFDTPGLEEHYAKVTKGEGFDALITSRPHLLPRSVWKSISTCGRCAFLEVGPGGDSHIENSQWPCNGTMTQVSIGHLLNCACQNHQRKLHQLLKGALALCRLDEISFNREYTHVDISDLISTVDKLPKDKPSPRLMLSLENDQSQLEVTASQYSYEFDPEKTYLLVGCLGGLGRALSSWMQKRGAKRFVFLGRSGLDRKPARDLVEMLSSSGAIVDVVRGDVTSAADVLRMIQAAKTPIGGVVQAAMGLKEIVFSQMTADDWHTGIDPKCYGTWNLHRGLQQTGNEPGFFLLLSSLNGSVGAFMESNYCAANAFLDAFARYRRNLGLAGTALALGAISGVGYVAENPEVEAHFLRRGIRSLNEEELLQMIDIALSNSLSNDSEQDIFDALSTSHILTGLEPLDPQTLAAFDMKQRNPVEDDPRAILWSKAYEANQQSSGKEDNELANVIKVIKRSFDDSGRDTAATAGNGYGGAIEAVIPMVAKGLGDLVVRSADQIETTKPISSYGLDSMLAAEYRTWVYRTFHVDVPLMEILSSTSTIETLSKQVCEGLCQALA